MDFLLTLLEDGYTWYTFSFLIFGFIIMKHGLPVIHKALDGRIDNIKKDLENAESLRVEAQEMLAQYQRKHRDAEQESKAILKTARDTVAQFKDKISAELDETIARRESQLEDRLENMKRNALQEIKTYAANLSMDAAKHIIIEGLDKKTNARLVDQSIIGLNANIN